MKTNKACEVVPIEKGSHVKLFGRGKHSAEQEKIDGVQCLNELLLACHLLFLAALIHLF